MPQGTELPAAPQTLEGASVLHQMFRVRWSAWKALSDAERNRVLTAGTPTLDRMGAKHTALYSVLGHKADLMLVHFRNSFEELKQVELSLQQTPLWDFLEPADSFLSVVELGLYESTVKVYRGLKDKSVAPHSEPWNAAIAEVIERQTDAMRIRLWPEIPTNRYICFYPMDRRRGEVKNFYMLPIEERQRQMDEHGAVGRRYAGKVKQIITGAIGFDDWEWGVDLFADDPLIFKKLIYEMRFDEVSAVYALFGKFYVGLRCPVASLAELLSGRLPSLK